MIIGMGALFLALALTACEKEAMPRNNVLDQHNPEAAPGSLLPSVADGSVEDVYSNGALFCGKVIAEGGSPVHERGVCYNYSGNPSVSYYRLSAGRGPGQYACIISNLVPGHVYYFRAYAINGNGVSYGHVMSFQTPLQ